MSKWKLFFTSLFLTTGVLLTEMYLNRRPVPKIPVLEQITGKIFITSQLAPKDVLYVRGRGIKTIVDMRPDGEVDGQPSSEEISSTAAKIDIGFHYIPVPHESIPESAVEELHQVLSKEATPALLYCRTGRRAVRLFALEEASRAEGPDAAAIQEMVRKAGFSADDLKEDINRRISHRSDSQPIKQ